MANYANVICIGKPEPHKYIALLVGEPVPQPRVRVSTRGGFARAYVPSNHPVHAFRQQISRLASRCWQTDQPVSVTINAVFSRPKSHYNKSGVKASAPLLPRADADNVAKAVLDAITDSGAIWHDDKQVAKLTVDKRYGDQGFTEIIIETNS
jgi:Holliday junction resolvase RusA-like endonuclease